MLIYTYKCSCRIHTDVIINDDRSDFNKICPSHFIVRFERVIQSFMVRGSWRPNRNCNILTPLLWPSAWCLSRSPGAQPEAQGLSSLLGDGFLYCILSATSLDPNSSGPQGPPPPGFLYHILFSNSSNLKLSDFLSWPSYIIVQRPLNRQLNLWNGMFDRHQAEITAMQFRGHSLPVHHSEVGPSPYSIISAELTCAISSHNCHWNVSLPSGAWLWMAFWAGSKVKIQQINLGST